MKRHFGKVRLGCSCLAMQTHSVKPSTALLLRYIKFVATDFTELPTSVPDLSFGLFLFVAELLFFPITLIYPLLYH